MNRETAVFLVPVFALYAWHSLPRRRFAELLGAQIVVVVAARGLLELAAVGTGELSNVLFHPPAAFMPTSGPEAAAVVAALMMLALAGTLRPRPALALAPISIAAYFVAGSPGEYRVFLEAVPALVVAAGALASHLALALYRTQQLATHSS